MADASPSAANRREQLRHLNDSLVSGSLSRQEYDELLPFVASPTSQQPPQPQSQERGEGEDAAFAAALAQAQQPSDPAASASEAESQLSSNSPQQQQRSVHFAAPEPIEAPPQYQILAPVAAANVGAGLQLRCPACGTSNDTARGPRCYVCSSKLTVADELSAAVAARSSYGGRSSRAARWPIVTATAPPSGVFSAAENGRVVLLNGYFSCAMETTQVVATADGSACQVFVMCCTWQPRDGDNQQQLLATWYVSQRFSQFERLHKALKRRLSRSTAAALPPFPAKYHLTDRLEKRKQGLAAYIPRLLELCAHLPNGAPTPELDEFLDASHQIQIFRSQQPAPAPAPAPPLASASPPVDGSQRSPASTSTAATSVSSPFPAFTGPAMVPSQPAATPMDATELAQAEGAVRLLAQAVRNACGDVRDDGTIQHHLDMCVQLAPALQRSADLDNPFADSELIPRAMQCQEDLQQAVALYNDALLAVSGVAPIQQQVQHAQNVQQTEPHVQAQMPVRNVVPASAA